ncbi:MAG: hypothetical protein E5Y06_12420 [Mesorhizobium sp.]|uniref:hypothetical protein n=1 Tax=Mesorhizobium sp. TaxID=1871066 RepID=UPI001215A998|nr:hypothetical protein [Mesorhizobium sp.]TIN95548.1 MAG: hypothetical protein E5Y06_12420 [Mesorhizobium sp.]TJU97195.1 MAG: hypothetical protein E5Y08_19010 [Mesorhizobium sp.]
MDFVFSLATVFVTIGAALEFFFGVAVFYNPSDDFRLRYESLALPAIMAGEQYQIEYGEQLNAHASYEFHADQIRKFVTEKSSGASVYTATEILNDMVSCQNSFLCKIDNYPSYREQIRRFWFTFRPVIMDMRDVSKIVPKNFGSELEKEAGKILTEDQAAGLL